MGADVTKRITSTIPATSLIKNSGDWMSLLSIFLTESPTTSGLFFNNAVRTPSKGSLQNARSRNCTACPARSADSATIHAPIGMTGMGKWLRFVFMIRTFIAQPCSFIIHDNHTRGECGTHHEYDTRFPLSSRKAGTDPDRLKSFRFQVHMPQVSQETITRNVKTLPSTFRKVL